MFQVVKSTRFLVGAVMATSKLPLGISMRASPGQFTLSMCRALHRFN